MSITTPLAPLRAHAGMRCTQGLGDAVLARFAQDPDLLAAIAAAAAEYAQIRHECADLLDLNEDAQIAAVQSGYVNFYAADAVNPYIALAARGPWVVTLKGAVLHDSGGYGMLGFGHTPAAVIEAMAKPQVMANIMTPALAQWRLDQALRQEVGRTRGGCPYTAFMCLNSGSEAVSLAARIIDTHAKTMTDPDGRYPGRTIKRLVVKGSFHGRTDRPALYSDSSRAVYQQHLASYRDDCSVLTIAPYDADALQQVFAEAERQGWFIEAMFLEPVMGEGDPGRSVPPAFYALARQLTREHGSLFLIDSIQAGLRATGALSIIDYPGFENMEAPDLETWSKALNAGQYPLSVLAATAEAAAIYQRGTYGNTMTTNPRALEVACAVLAQLTPQMRANIRERGRQALDKLRALQTELGEDVITAVQGTGLLFSCALAPRFKCYGAASIEQWLREHGIGVIHGGDNSLRFTPHFAITEAELDLIVQMVKVAVQEASSLE